MPIAKIKKTRNYTYVFWKIEEKTKDLLNELKGEKDELEDIKNIKHITRKKQNIAARLLLNYLSKKKEKLLYLKNGSPYCKNLKHISISHSKDYCVVISSSHPIGIDIQHQKSNIEVISKKFINNKEKIHINNNQSIIQLHFIWCAKEAIYKTLNNNACSFKKDIYIDSENRMKATGYYNNTKYNLHYEVFENYFLAIAQQNYD